MNRKSYPYKKYRSEDGMTLMEVMLAMVLLSIIMMAVFSGMQYAFNILQSSDAFTEETYQVIGSQEKNLTLTTTLSDDDTTLDAATVSLVEDNIAGLKTDVNRNYPIYFEWTDSSSSDLVDFTTNGIRIDWTGDEAYLEKDIGIFIPVDNEETVVVPTP